MSNMKSKLLTGSVLIGALLTAAYAAAAAPSSASLQVTSDLKIPGASLPAGSYTVSVEDRLIDRAIVRIAGSSSATPFLVLAVPSKRLSGLDGSFSYFVADNNGQALRGWNCDGCTTPLEFVYPKADAVALTASSGKPVLAMDPVYDKLPANLGAEDMKVVTLWLVKPETVTADNKGQGVTAAKLADVHDAGEEDSAQSSKKPRANQEVAEVRMPARKLPHTAGYTYTFLAAGFALLFGAVLLRQRGSYRA